MISLFCLTHRFKRSMLEISSEISYSELRDYLRPLQNKILPDNVLFKIAFGKKDMILYAFSKVVERAFILRK